MTDESGPFDHLFADPIRASMDEAGYGSWRSISAPDAVSLSFGFPFPESFPNDELVDAAEAVFAEHGDRTLQYGGDDYADQLSDVVAGHARDRGVDCDAEDVLLTNGATHAIDVVAHTFLDMGDDVFVEAPTFMGTLKLLRNYGVDIHGFDVDEGGLDVDAVADELERRRAEGEAMPKLLYTIPNFQNPMGTTLTRERRERLLELAAEYDFVVLEDDAYGDLRYDGDDIAPLAALDDSGRVIHLGTFSKTIAPGVRTGWVVADEAIFPQLRRVAAGGTNVFTQSVLAKFCEGGRLDENIADLCEAYEERRDHMLGCLDDYMPAEATWTEPDGGFFVWVELPDGVDTDEMLAVAADEGVTYLPGEMFFPDDRGEECLRISFSHVSLDEMERGIEALGEASRLAIADL